jgi:hypothetical protein
MPNFDELYGEMPSWWKVILFESSADRTCQNHGVFQPIQQNKPLRRLVFDLGQNASGIIELKKVIKAIRRFDLRNYSMPMVLSTKRLLEVPIFSVMFSKEKASKHGNHALAIMVFDIYK